MTSDWQEVVLRDVTESITVGHVGPMADEYVESGIPFLRALNILPYRLNLGEVKYISPSFHERLRKSSLQPGDVVVVRTGKPGTATVIPEHLEVANCSDLVIIRPGDGIDARYLAYYFNSSAGQSHVDARSVGSVQKHFNIGDARRMKLRVPPPLVQERIADILGSLDDKIEAGKITSADDVLVSAPDRPAEFVYSSTKVYRGMPVTLSSGNYEIRLRNSKGEIVEDSVKKLVVFQRDRVGVGYTVIPEDKWTTPEQTYNPRTSVLAYHLFEGARY